MGGRGVVIQACTFCSRGYVVTLCVWQCAFSIETNKAVTLNKHICLCAKIMMTMIDESKENPLAAYCAVVIYDENINGLTPPTVDESTHSDGDDGNLLVEIRRGNRDIPCKCFCCITALFYTGLV